MMAAKSVGTPTSRPASPTMYAACRSLPASLPWSSVVCLLERAGEIARLTTPVPTPSTPAIQQPPNQSLSLSAAGLVVVTSTRSDTSTVSSVHRGCRRAVMTRRVPLPETAIRGSSLLAGCLRTYVLACSSLLTASLVTLMQAADMAARRTKDTVASDRLVIASSRSKTILDRLSLASCRRAFPRPRCLCV